MVAVLAGCDDGGEVSQAMWRCSNRVVRCWGYCLLILTRANKLCHRGSRLCAARVGVLTAHRLYVHRLHFVCCLTTLVIMSATEAETQVATTTTATKKVKKLKPARKQVKPGEVEKKEAPQTGKEYSA